VLNFLEIISKIILLMPPVYFSDIRSLFEELKIEFLKINLHFYFLKLKGSDNIYTEIFKEIKFPILTLFVALKSTIF